jgi:hypothetical protein
VNGRFEGGHTRLACRRVAVFLVDYRLSASRDVRLSLILERPGNVAPWTESIGLLESLGTAGAFFTAAASSANAAIAGPRVPGAAVKGGLIREGLEPAF